MDGLVLVAAASDNNTLFGALSAISLLLTAGTSWLVYRRDHGASDRDESAAVMTAEREGWEMLLNNLRVEYASALEQLERTQKQLNETRQELEQMRQRLQDAERRLRPQGQ